MYRLLWLIPIALVLLALWLPSLIPAGVLAFIGHALLSIIGIALVVLLIMWLLASSMKS